MFLTALKNVDKVRNFLLYFYPFTIIDLQAEVAVEVGVAEDPLMEVKARKERKNVETREDLDGPPIFCGLQEGNHFPPYFRNE